MLAADSGCHSHIAGSDFATDSVEAEEVETGPAVPILAASRLGCQRQCQEGVRRDGARVGEEEMRTAEVEIAYTAVEGAEGGGRSCYSATEVVEEVCIAGAGCP